MSGGTFDYKQYELEDIADYIEKRIADNNSSESSYSLETINKFKECVKLLRRAGIYCQRIDWLISGDDGEETFHKRLNEELTKL